MLELGDVQLWDKRQLLDWQLSCFYSLIPVLSVVYWQCAPKTTCPHTFFPGTGKGITGKQTCRLFKKTPPVLHWVLKFSLSLPILCWILDKLWSFELSFDFASPCASISFVVYSPDYVCSAWGLILVLTYWDFYNLILEKCLVLLKEQTNKIHSTVTAWSFQGN